MLSLFIEAVRIRNAHKRHHLVLSSESINNVNWPQKIVLKTLYNDQLTQSTQLIKSNHLLIPPPPSPEKREKNTSTQFLKKLIPSIQNKLCLHPQPPSSKMLSRIYLGSHQQNMTTCTYNYRCSQLDVKHVSYYLTDCKNLCFLP